MMDCIDVVKKVRIEYFELALWCAEIGMNDEESVLDVGFSHKGVFGLTR